MSTRTDLLNITHHLYRLYLKVKTLNTDNTLTHLIKMITAFLFITVSKMYLLIGCITAFVHNPICDIFNVKNPCCKCLI